MRPQQEPGVMPKPVLGHGPCAARMARSDGLRLIYFQPVTRDVSSYANSFWGKYCEHYAQNILLSREYAFQERWNSMFKKWIHEEAHRDCARVIHIFLDAFRKMVKIYARSFVFIWKKINSSRGEKNYRINLCFVGCFTVYSNLEMRGHASRRACVFPQP